MTPIDALHKAIYERLAAACGALTPPVPVFDHVPQDQAYPFVEIGGFEAETTDLLYEPMTRVTVPIGVHTQRRGQKQSHDLNGVIRATLHDQLFDIDEGAVVQCIVVRQVNDTLGDGLTYVASSILSIILEH